MGGGSAVRRGPAWAAWCGLILLAATLLPAGQSAGAEEPTQRLLVALNPVPGMISASAEQPGSAFKVVHVPSHAAHDALAAARRDPKVRIAELDHPVQALFEPNDQNYAQQWAPAKINAPKAWDLATGSDGIIIAIIDSGIDANHPDFRGRVLAGYNYVNNNTDTTDEYGHGTHVAGIAAAGGNDGIGIVGIAYGAKILPIKVLDASGGGNISGVISGLDFARERGAKVVNISLGATENSVLLQEAIDRATAAGMIVIAAAGNSGLSKNTPSYPAASDGVVAVAATDSADKRASFSTAGGYVQLAAPGASIYSTYKGGGYRMMSGTSMASPHVAGLAALIWSRQPTLPAADVIAAMRDTAVDLGTVGRDTEFGFGRIDAGTWAQKAAIQGGGKDGGSGSATGTPPPAGDNWKRVYVTNAFVFRTQ